MNEDQELQLLGLTIELACYHKWSEGRRVYGGETFTGDPLVCLHAEAIDAINYVQEEMRRNRLPEDVLYHLQECAVELARGARIAAEKVGIEPRRPAENYPLGLETDNRNRPPTSVRPDWTGPATEGSD